MQLSLKIIFLILFFPFSGICDEIPEYSVSVKGLGMGNAFTGQAKGHDALFYNPAAFAEMKGVQFRLMGLNIGLNGLDSYDEYKDIYDNTSDVAATLNALYGRPVWARVDYQMSLSTGPLIFGAYSRANLGFTLLNPALPSLDANYFADYAVFGGVGIPLIPQYLDAGVIVKRITRFAGGGDITAATLASLDSETIKNASARTGVAYGLDYGAKLQLPSSWHPSAAFAWQDIGNTSFSYSATEIPPDSIKSRMNVALGLEKDFMGLVQLRPALEFKDVEGRSHAQIGKKMHAGLELQLPVVTLRGGFNQGYYTYGASFDLWLFQVDVASYAVELGEYVGQNEDRRYIFQLVMDFGVDEISGDWFNFSKSRRGKRSGIKQRR